MNRITKIFIIIGIVLSVIVLLAIMAWPILSLAFSNIYGYLSGIFTNSNLLITIGILATIGLALFLSIAFIIPVMIYVFKKISAYISLVFICIRRKYKFEIKRFPFASLKNMTSDGDIIIKSKGKVLHIHFIDIVFPHRRALTIPNEHEYVITSTRVSRISKRGGQWRPGMANMSGQRVVVFQATEHSLNEHSDKIKKLPLITNEKGVEHILLISNIPVEMKCIGIEAGTTLTSGHKIGEMTFCGIGYLKKGLKDKLHVSIFD